jgi:uncharacterized SAM-binding protein YcdF (DUF218 family)
MIDAQYPTVETPQTPGMQESPRSSMRRGLLMRLSFLALIAAFFIGFAVFTKHVTGMSQPETIAAADAIVVLTGGTDRLKPAIELLKNGSGKKLLISGVNPETTKKDIVRAYSISPELAACCLDIDQISANTVGNATQSAKWLRINGFSSVILVTSNYHMPRAEKELHRLAGSMKITRFPLVNSDLRNWKWLEQPDAFRLILTEYLKYILASARHLVAPVPSKAELARISG